jgi:hypothetical protein
MQPRYGFAKLSACHSKPWHIMWDTLFWSCCLWNVNDVFAQAEAQARVRQQLDASQELQQEAAAALVAISNQMVQGAVSVFVGCTRSSGPSTLLQRDAATCMPGSQVVVAARAMSHQS